MIDGAGYGKALFELALENGTEEQVYEELLLVRQAVEESPSYTTLLDTPAVSTEEKLVLVREAFGSMNPMLQNFLCILCEKRCFYQLPACISAYGKLYDEAHSILRATAITAVPMTGKQQAALKEKLEKLTGKRVILENQVDAALLGGMTLRYGGVQLDDSIRNRLDRLSKRLSDTIL